MTRTAIIREIMIRMDEILPPGESMSHPFDSYINSVLDESYRQILLECPVALLPLSEVTGTVIYEPTTTELAYVPVPDDFIRVGLFKFSDWENPATKHITVDSQQYKNIQTGVIAGGVVYPVVLLTHAKKGSDTVPGRYLVCYKVSTNSSKEYLFYVKYNKDTGIESLSDIVIGGLAWCCVAKLMQIFELPPMKFAEERYKQFIISNSK